MEKDDVYCDTELCLSPGGSTASRRPHHSASNSNTTMKSGSLCSTINPNNNEQHQQITIFYGGRMCTCDVTEMQARAIICMAKQDMEERTAARPPQLINPGLSMKTSLHHFLQKRKARVTSPSNE